MGEVLKCKIIRWIDDNIYYICDDNLLGRIHWHNFLCAWSSDANIFPFGYGFGITF